MIKKRTKKTFQKVAVGIVHISSTFNNTKVVVTNLSGGAIAWSSAGSNGFQGAKKSTPFAAQIAATKATQCAIDRHGLKTVSIEINGPGSGREAAVRAVAALGLNVTSIKDVTGIPHNGNRKPGRKRT